MKSCWFFVVSFVLIQTGRTCESPWTQYNLLCARYFEEQVIHSVAEDRCQSEAGQIMECSSINDFGKRSEKNGTSSYWCDKRKDDILSSVSPLTDSASTLASINQSNGIQCYYIQNKAVLEGGCNQRKGFICGKDLTTPVICPQGTEKVGRYCFWQHKELLDRNTSERACEEKSGHLAILLSNDEVRYGYAAVNQTKESFWVGAREQEGKLIWESGAALDPGANKSFIGFNNHSGIFLRLGLDNASASGAAWILTDSNITAYALCEKRHLDTAVITANSTCPEGYTAEEGVCYSQSWVRMSWRAARRYCEHSAGDLVSFMDEKENKIPMPFTAKFNTYEEKMWIGLRKYRNDDKNVFRWSDGSNLTYQNWAPGQPPEDNDTKLCVARSGRSLKWEVDDCTTERFFICKTDTEAICGGDLHSDIGDIQSPNFPRAYRGLENCTWKITVTEGYRVDLAFSKFDLEDSKDCEKDFVKILDGHEINSPTLGTYCGDRKPWSIRSSNNKISIQFVTDDVENQHGFNVTFAKGTCGESIHSDNGTFQSPNYPNPYPKHMNCSWEITVPEGYQVILQFKDFKLEDSEHCKFDFVEILDGHESDSVVLGTGKYCGSSKPGIILSTTNKMSIIFVTEKGTVEPGFSAVFTKGQLCPKPKQPDDLKWWKFQDHCYMIPPTPYHLTWNEADRFCQRHNASLASVHSVLELDYLRLLHPKSVNSWLGLRAKDLHSAHDWSDGTPTDFLQLDKDLIYDNSSDADVCISLDISTELMAKGNCYDLLSVLCKFQLKINKVITTLSPTPTMTSSSVDTCPDARWKAFGNKCYKFSEYRHYLRKKTWADADDECKKSGSTLVTFHSRQEQDFVLLNVSRGHKELWTGMDNSYLWTDHVIAHFTDWDDGEPKWNGKQKQCVSLKNTNHSVGLWRTMDCNQLLPYVCQITTGTIPAAPQDYSSLPSTSSVSHQESDIISSTSSVTHWDSSTTTTNTGNSDNPHITIYLSVGIPLAIVVLISSFLIARILRTPKHYNRMKEPPVKFINQRNRKNSSSDEESMGSSNGIALNEYHKLPTF